MSLVSDQPIAYLYFVVFITTIRVHYSAWDTTESPLPSPPGTNLSAATLAAASFDGNAGRGVELALPLEEALDPCFRR